LVADYLIRHYVPEEKRNDDEKGNKGGEKSWREATQVQLSPEGEGVPKIFAV
jgi:hypothetical protein